MTDAGQDTVEDERDSLRTDGGPTGQLRDRLPADRQELETAFDRIVRENRFTIAVLFPAVGAILLIASAEGLLPGPLAFNPWLVLTGVIVMRAPLIGGVLPVVDRRALAGVAGLTAYTYAIETLGVSTGWPYGEFEYAVSLGPMLEGVPIALPVFFIPLVVNAYLLWLLLLGPRAARVSVRLATIIPTIVLMDVVLDPGAVALGFWSFDVGQFYNVPLSNYGGWVLSAAAAVIALDWGFDRARLIDRLRSCEFMLDDMVSFVLLWGGINIWYGNLIPAGVALVFGVALLRADRFDAQLLNPRREIDSPASDESQKL
ncbi:MAG: carotene biosynthesis associated membrane protein [uncultured archaeon A07HR60]|nr:MAG: carotene biosynthesis associated membrane protein [uncultured archaeon A07HR60]